MTARASWDPTQYLRYEGERLRPVVDLIGRIAHPGPRLVVDLGCGAGNALPLLAARFPGAEVRGVDGSAAMLAKAAGQGFATELADIAGWAPAMPPDVIFSNAALHWLPDHAALFPRLLGLLAPGGVLAVQMPAMDHAPFRTSILAVARAGPWAARLADVPALHGCAPPAFFYDLLAPRCAALDLWCTEYCHVLRGPDPIVQWAMGTSLRPYLDALAQEEQVAFLAAYRAALRPHHPPQADGATLLQFRRLFLMAGVAGG